MLNSMVGLKDMTNLLRVVLFCALVESLLITSNTCFADNSDNIIKQDTYTNGTCGTDELNHSILVQCNAPSRCQNSVESSIDTGTATIWPASPDEVLHVYSSRSGQRLSQATMKNLNYIVDDHMKLFDINTTLTIDKEWASSDKIGNRLGILGLGGTLEAKKLALAIENNSFERMFSSVFDSMFGITGSDAHLDLLRLTMEFNLVREHDLASILREVDKQVARSKNQEPNHSRLKIIVDLKKLPASGDRDLTSLFALLSDVKNYLASTEIWALALDQEDLKSLSGATKPRIDYLLFSSVALEQAPDFVDWLKGERVGLKVNGLLVKSQYSIAYNVLEYLEKHDELIVLTVGRTRPRTKYYGDWQNAQEYTIEVLNHLKHGLNGFIEDVSVIELKSPESMASNSDASIYSLAQSHDKLFKGPMFYATCHFSRYLSASRPIDYKISTSPNMFSAHYSAFVTLDKQYIVLVVSNGNEHILPFSWVIGDKLVAHAGLEPKSFNTFIIKMK